MKLYAELVGYKDAASAFTQLTATLKANIVSGAFAEALKVVAQANGVNTFDNIVVSSSLTVENFSPTANPTIAPTPLPTAAPVASPGSSSSSSESSGSLGAIIGGVVGGIVVLAIIAFCLWYFVFNNRVPTGKIYTVATAERVD
jgi:hypothetical protein